MRLPEVAADGASRRLQPEPKDGAFDQVERLPNNIGYIKFDGFIASGACADVRNRGGGGSDKGPDLLSYLFEQPTHFSDFWDRTTGRTTPTCATVVGEVSGGGSHLTSAERIDDRFNIRVPYGRPINPITETDWEGVGVIPDVKVPASEALAAAEKLASEELQKSK